MTKVINFKKYTSIKIGGKYPVKIINSIENNLDYKIIGSGNNLLISNNPPKLAILGDEFDYIIRKGNQLIVGAATSSIKLLLYCKKNNIADFEFISKIPGTIGGLIKMNAGLKQWEIFNNLHSIKTQNGEILKQDIKYEYRCASISGIIYEVKFCIKSGFDTLKQKKIIKLRNNQPKIPSAGSCFKNPKEYSAGYLLEQVGLKGYCIGGVSFSSIHANFLVNQGGGTFDEAIKLINLAKYKVKKIFNIDLKEEIIII